MKFQLLNKFLKVAKQEINQEKIKLLWRDTTSNPQRSKNKC